MRPSGFTCREHDTVTQDFLLYKQSPTNQSLINELISESRVKSLSSPYTLFNRCISFSEKENADVSQAFCRTAHVHEEGAGRCSPADEGATEEVDAVQLREDPRDHVRRGAQRGRRRDLPFLLWRWRHGRSVRRTPVASAFDWASWRLATDRN